MIASPHQNRIDQFTTLERERQRGRYDVRQANETPTFLAAAPDTL